MHSVLEEVYTKVEGAGIMDVTGSRHKAHFYAQLVKLEKLGMF